jgi:hypothetical protein
MPGAPVTAAGHFTFRGNGIGDATFGQPTAVAIAELDEVLGSPTTPRPASDAGNCTTFTLDGRGQRGSSSARRYH